MQNLQFIVGFYLRGCDSRSPDRIRIIDLPPCHPELKAFEQLWDLIKGETGNRVFETLEELRAATLPAVKRYGDDAAAVLVWRQKWI